jgi:2-C-methyl-D-erythritol 4-phosphate cytidylyltransferase
MAKIWGIVPAAGIGSRMQSDRPKQYLLLNNKPIIEHAISCLLPAVSGIAIAIADHDRWWSFPSSPLLVRCAGGEQRVNSVLSALDKLLEVGAIESDWVLVHDAARPLLPDQDLGKIISHIRAGNTSPVILATPLADTIKKSADGVAVSSTVDRNQLWRALTPQASPLGLLRDSLLHALEAGVSITDESSALEYAGHPPVIISGCPSNLKITLPSDLLIAEALLKSQGGK